MGMRIDLPRFQWFIQKQGDMFATNIYSIYSGSLGTNPAKGCIANLTFNYLAYVDVSSNDESGFRLVAEGFNIQPWGRRKTDFERAEFDNSPKVIRDAGEWLGKIAAKYGFLEGKSACKTIRFPT